MLALHPITQIEVAALFGARQFVKSVQIGERVGHSAGSSNSE